MTLQHSLCTFRIGTISLGVEVRRVQEVIRAQRLTRVPGGPQAVRGLLNLRGQIVTALDLRQVFNVEHTEDPERLMNVVMRTIDGPVSFLVNEISDVVAVDKEYLESPPETLQGKVRHMIVGTYKLKDRLILVLNLEAIMKLTV